MMMEPAVHIRRMTLADLRSVIEIDRQSFSMPWSESTYRNELMANPAAYLYVAEEEGQETVIGYIGFWFIVDEAHISTLAVDARYRRQGIGRRLLQTALFEAARLGAEIVSLEVRASNGAALQLYRDFGFQLQERRAGYYQDNGEDALYMLLGNLEPWRGSTREVDRDTRRNLE
jgi:ribosomal-protein-alanine N-acetyltransferase